MYLKQIIDQIGDAVNDSTLKSTGTNSARTKQWVQEFYYMDLPTRRDWRFLDKEGTITTTSGTARYNLPRWVDTPSKLKALIHPTSLQPLTQEREVVIKPKYDPSVYGDPAYYVIGPRVRTSYSTGTISATSGSKTVTGSSTSWSASTIEQFDLLQVGNYVYTVASVDSSTSITVFEDIISTISAGTSYSILMDRWTVDFYPTPNATLSIAVRAQNIVPKLDDNADVPVLPDNWHHLLVKAGIVRALKHNNDDFTAELQELELAIRKLAQEDGRSADYIETVSIPRSRTY